VIVRQGESHGYFFMINRGFVDVTMARDAGAATTIARLGPGQYFGEIELLHTSKPIAGIRASREGPVELVALNREIFNALMADAAAMRASIDQVAQARMKDNLTRTGARPPATVAPPTKPAAPRRRRLARLFRRKEARHE